MMKENALTSDEIVELTKQYVKTGQEFIEQRARELGVAPGAVFSVIAAMTPPPPGPPEELIWGYCGRSPQLPTKRLQ
jgi:hypothetical protein